MNTNTLQVNLTGTSAKRGIRMERKSGSKQKRQQEQKLIDEYHKMVTEQALEP